MNRNCSACNIKIDINKYKMIELFVNPVTIKIKIKQKTEMSHYLQIQLLLLTNLKTFIITKTEH